jgi:hypothetical protein
VSELAIASSDAAPDEIVAVWHDYTTLESTSRKLGVGVSLDAGRTWTTDLLPRAIDDDLDCTQAIDPFAFADARTGRMWVGAAASGCPGRRIVLALKAPSSATVGATVGDRVFL